MYPALLFLFIYFVIIFEYVNNDSITSSSEIFPLNAPGDGIYLNKTGDALLDFKVSVNNFVFDNDDNPYGKFRLHIYTNMEN